MCVSPEAEPRAGGNQKNELKNTVLYESTRAPYGPWRSGSHRWPSTHTPLLARSLRRVSSDLCDYSVMCVDVGRAVRAQTPVTSLSLVVVHASGPAPRAVRNHTQHAPASTAGALVCGSRTRIH